MKRRGANSIAANPVLIGAATTLVVVVAVFLAYNANNGLPFVPTYEVKADVPSAANLVRGNDVRLGGARVGVVEEIAPVKHADGSVSALLTMKLQTNVKPLPKSSTLIIRSKSALGLKYVEITEGPRKLPDGRAAPGFASGDTIPEANATPEPVEIDQVFNTFDEPTRVASRKNLLEFGGGLAGRGTQLNFALQDFNPLLLNLTKVMRYLSDSQTDLKSLFPALERAASIVAPVAETQARLFVNLDLTFGALAEVARPFIQDSIAEAPETLDVAVESFRVQRPFLANAEGLFRELRPGVRALRIAAPTLASALEVGTPTLIRSQALNRRLIPLFRAVERFSLNPLVPVGIRDLTQTAQILNPIVAGLKPEQTVCNYLSLWFRNVSSLLSEGDANGTWQRFIIVPTPSGPNNEGGPSSAPANGPGRDNHLRTNPYPNVGAPGETAECEAANEPFAAGQTVIGNTPGNQGTNTEKTVVDRAR
ncbi:MAG: MlaD family protein [Solirubrobacteraceae bacterium]